jgi:hypothetical protein
MKPVMYLVLGIVALSFAAGIQAATINLYLTGSTAYRGATHNAIKNYATGVADAGTLAFGYTGTSFTGAGQAYFTWTQGAGADTYNVFTSWSGSEGGLQTVGDSTKLVNFLPTTTTVSAGGTSGAAAGTDAHHPDAAMSDSFQSSSAFFGTFQGVTYDTLTEATGTTGGLGIVPFKWCANKGSLVTAVTSQQLRQLYSAGKVPLAIFSGSSGDHTKPVLALGRDPDSGTRLTAFADSGVGSLATVTQFQPQDSTSTLVKTSSATIAKFIKWPASTVNGIAYGTGNGGYSSGGDLSKAMAAPLASTVTITPAGTGSPYSGSNVSLIGYLGTSDADANLLNGGNPNQGIELSYNGTTLGNVAGDYNTVAVLTEGKFSYWGYEHMYYNASTISVSTQGVADGIATQLKNTDATVKISNMVVKRDTDGSPVKNNYAAP